MATYDTAGNPTPLYDTTGRMVLGGRGETPGGGDPGESTRSLMAALDATHEYMRPNGLACFTATVAQDGTGDYTKISEALAAGANARVNAMRDAGINEATPNFWIEVKVKPGDYVDNVNASRWTALYGAGSGEVTITQNLDQAPPLGTLNHSGGVYAEGITWRKTGDLGGFNPKYPVHGVNSLTSVYVDCRFEHLGGGNAGIAHGSDGSNFGTYVFYHCATIGGAMGGHDWESTHDPKHCVFVNCSTDGNTRWRTLNDVAPDETWVIGGTHGSVTTAGANSILHLDPEANITGAITVGGSQDTDLSWPVPWGAVSAWDRERYNLPTAAPPVPLDTPGY